MTFIDRAKGLDATTVEIRRPVLDGLSIPGGPGIYLKVQGPRDVSNLEMSPLKTLYRTCENAESVFQCRVLKEEYTSCCRSQRKRPMPVLHCPRHALAISYSRDSLCIHVHWNWC